MRHQGKPKVFRVAVLAGSSLTWREQVMRGIAAFSNERGHWHVYTSPEGEEDSVFFSDRYRWDGLIVRPTSLRFVKRVLRLGVPAVAIGSVRVPSVKLPRVKVDDDELMHAAIRHLISGGLRRFAYCSLFSSRIAEDRGPAFARAAAEMGYPCTFYRDLAKPTAGTTWQKRQRELVRWVRKLQKPVGVLTWNPDVACQLVEACNLAKVAVPRDVAVVSADDDTAKCTLTSPTISSAPIPAARIGYEAAALLQKMMNGAQPPAQPILVRPAGIVVMRESSDNAAMEGRDVHLAVQFIRDNATSGIGVNDVAKALQVSRRSLERHFRRVLDCSPHEEIDRQKLEHAKRLLLETDWLIFKIAAKSGYSSPSYLNHAFRRSTGLSPGEFRRRFQSPGKADK